MTVEGTLLLRRAEVAELLSLSECVDAIEEMFRLHGEGRTRPPGILGVHVPAGGFHIKTGWMDGAESAYFVAKLNANFPQNVTRYGLPLIQGVVVLCDAENGYPLAVMDSTEITVKRTGAATAVAAKYLARKDASIATICGCGNQGRVSLLALADIFPLKRVYVYDQEPGRSGQFSADLSDLLELEVVPTGDLASAVRASDICVTCTPSTRAFMEREWVAPGAFVAAVGADSEHKQEIDPHLLTESKLVVDLLDQCAVIGELHHALDAGLLTRSDVHAELGEVVAGVKPGRSHPLETIVFDSTGMALQDVAAARVVYEKALDEGIGSRIDFAA
jgi:alanine dehydrogenase